MKVSFVSFFAAVTLLVFLAACSNADMGDPSQVAEDCPHGVDGNGNCVKEGQDPRPYGGKSKPGH
ncbi:hypothetical protein [Nitrosomonas sp. sh817]|uniref:hypothetical protein n=1 Tax=Nitrosomonas sp. sh817 TaxID=3070658 RepID=UPI0027DBAD3B|nr:hypothetical protein [Nitrosomonas sp. sh817]WMJ09590.1 hypothetical protein RBH92_05190 [Nitrosomonas sp. sh817]